MGFYTVYVGGERLDRDNTAEDIANVQKVLTLAKSGCYTNLKEDGRIIGGLEHVLEALVSISYINGNNDLDAVIAMVVKTGITACAVVDHGADEDCLVEVSFKEVTP